MSAINKTRSPTKKVNATVYREPEVDETVRKENPVELSEKHQKLLARQAQIIKNMEDQGMLAIKSPRASKATIKQSPKSSVKSLTFEIGRRVGIWTANGNLSATYKK